MQVPRGMMGIRHIALFVHELELAIDFYVDIIGMRVEWQPDPDNVYLTNGGDVLALHRIDVAPNGLQRLDHIGFVLESAAAVDSWHDYLRLKKVTITEAPKTHRDGSRGLYCQDAVGHLLEFIYHPPIANRSATQLN